MPFNNTRAALVIYDGTEEDRAAIESAAFRCEDDDECIRGLEKYDKACDDAERAVQHAYYLDTQAYNTEADCMKLDIEHIRMLVDIA